jgi:anti-sigma factor ChrR (cupin superfamily)
MRRPRHRLQVSTFPFLAVLLCAMGSLILVLLVMDRRAKQVARAKALQTLAQADAEEQRRAEEQRDEWERRRRQLHAALLRQDQEVQAECRAVAARIEAALAEVKDEEKRRRKLEEQLRSESAALAKLEQELVLRRSRGTQAAERTATARAEVERLAAELGRLEETLAAVKAARQQAQQKYSVVPYRGARGDNRQPIYVECAATGVIFHPDRFTVPGSEVSRLTVRSEVEHRIAAMKGADTGKEERAYLLLLVRPDGILNYYCTAEALKGLPIAFGYELIDADWVLDFPKGDGPTPSGQTAGAESRPPDPATGSRPRGVTFGGGGDGTAEGRTAAPARGGTPPSPGAAGGTAEGSVLGTAVGVTAGLPARSALQPPAVPGAYSGPGSSPVAGVVRGAGTSAGMPPAPGGSQPSAPAIDTGTAPGPNQAVNVGPARGAGPDTRGRAGSPGLPGAAPANQPQGPPGSGGISSAGTATHGGSPAGGPSAGSEAAGGVSQGGTAESGDAGRGGTRDASGLAVPAERNPAKSAPWPVRTVGNRDWIIEVECAANAVIVHPTRLRLSLSTVKETRGADNALLQAVKQMIDRRQASVRPGEPPYRPQLRFLVRPDGLRTFHLAYPLLEPLRLPMRRQDIDSWEDAHAP